MSSRDAESTVVLRMLGDFENFIAKHSKKPSFCGNVTQQLMFEDSYTSCPRGSLDFDVTATSNQASILNSSSQMSSPEMVKKKADSLKRQSTADLISAKSKIARLESKLLESDTTNKRFKIECEREVEAVKLDYQNDKKRYEDLQKQLMMSTAKEAEAQREIRKLKSTLEFTKTEYEKDINSSQRDWNEMKLALDEQIAQLNEAVFMLERDLHREQMEKAALQSDLDTYEEQLQQYSKKSIDVTRFMQEAEKATEEADEARRRIKDLESELSQHEDDKKLLKILEGQVPKMKELEKENKQLKESNRILSLREENILLMKEKLYSSEKIIEKLENQMKSFLQYQLENEDLKQELNLWQNLTIVGCDSHISPQSVAKAIAELQQKNVLLLEQLGSHQSKNNSLERLNKGLEDELKRVKGELDGNRINLKHTGDQIRHLQRKLLLVSKERDACREFLDSYAKEVTMVPPLQENERVRNLEVIDGYKTAISVLETELQSCREQLQKSGLKLGGELNQEEERMKIEIKDLKAKLSAYESNILQLQEEKKLLELRIEYDTIKGEINPLKTRMVHLASNPVSWARRQRGDELELVKKENEVLRQRLKLLEETGPAAKDITIQIEEKLKADPPTKVLESLQEQLLASDAKNKRLLEGFKKISNEFREVTYVLLGYNIELPCSSQYKLSNMYAESPDDYLLFSKKESELELLETPYSRAVADKIDLYLHRNHSIPAFLSNITLDLFRSQTGITSTMLEANTISDITNQ